MMALRKRRKVVAASLVATVLLVSLWAGLTWMQPAPPGEDSRTFWQWYQLYPYPSPAGARFPIKDVVTEVKVITTPGLSWNETGAFIVDPTARMNFTRVVFESFPTAGYWFSGNVSAEFPVEQEVRFDIVFQVWEERGGTVVNMESDHVNTYLTDYDVVLRRGDYRPFEVQTTLENATFTFRITAVTEVYPLPANWKNIGVSFFRTGGFGVNPPGPGNLSANGSFVGTLIGSIISLGNSSIDLTFGPGQELKVPYDATYAFIRLEAPLTIGAVFVP